MLSSLLDPLPASGCIAKALIFRRSSLSSLTRNVALVNLVLCIMVSINTRYDVLLFLYGFHFVASSLLRRFLRFDHDTLRTKSHDSSVNSTK
ncbi:hypothetical protein BDN72DRAFT_436820 [Pluteus cervinus]|uniref:Uncharacterized protein n=1 Tax=Pluteus cervinus TaxID=181527 RepID=A0ACD3B0Y0_9AGAR|nr:hypothetical protein BDN72DRAFT_436820 [Pluteus cervinus]